MSTMHQRVSGHTARLLVAYLAQRLSRPMPALLAELELPPDTMSARELSFTKANMDRIWSTAVDRSEDPGLGLSLAEMLRPGMLGAVEYLFRNSRTLGDAYAHAVRFQNLLQQNTSRWRLEATETSTRYDYELLPPLADAHMHIAEFALTTFVRLGRLFGAEPWAPRAVSFMHRRQASSERYLAVLGVRPDFEAEGNRVVLDRATLEIPVAGADEHLANIVLEHAQREQALLQDATYSDGVRRVVATLLHRGDVTLKAVATELDSTERTLRRKLADEGTSFQAILDDVRFEVVKAYLAQPRLTTEEIAYLVGFSEVGAFYRAFRRWYGDSLSAYRTAHLNK